MKHEGSVSLFQYWDRLRSGRRAPKRTEIEPSDIRALLADTFILECDTRGQAVFRLAGTRLCAIFGRELKGFSFASLWNENDGRVIERLIGGTFHHKSVIVVEIDGLSRSGRHNGFELIVLPLEGGSDNPRALGALSAGERPYWLGADPIVACTISSLRVVDPDREPLFLKNRPAMAVPPLAPDSRSLATPTRRIRHLVVIDGGRGSQR